MTLRRFILGLAAAASLVAAAPSAHACSCFPLADDFWSTVTKHNANVTSGQWPQSYALTVVTARVAEHVDGTGRGFATEMKLDVDHVLQGQLTTAQIVVEGDNGMLCRPYVSRYPVGTTWVFAVNKLEGGADRFAVSGCGVYALATAAPGE